MKDSSLKAVNIVSLIILLLTLSGSAGYIYWWASKVKSETIPVVKELSREAYDLFSLKSGDGQELRRFRTQLVDTPNVKSLIVYNYDQSLVYAYARNPRFIRFTADRNDLSRELIDIPSRQFFDTTISNRFSNTHIYYSEAVVETLPDDLILKTALLLFAALFLLSLFNLLSLFQASRAGSRPSPETVTAPSSKAASPRTPHAASSPESLSTLQEETEHFDTDFAENHFHAREYVEEDGMYAPDSLLCYEKHLSDRLDNELKRAASFDQDLVCAIVSRTETRDHSHFIHLADFLRRHFEFHDLLFEYGQAKAAVILPNTELEEALADFSDFQKELLHEELPYRFELAIGLSSRNGRLIDSSLLLKEAAAAFNKAVNDSETHIVGFKPDPGKFRSYLAEQS